jgi:hypothetical protein
MAHFNLADYQTVQDRVDLFWEQYPKGRFDLDIVHMDSTQVVIRARVWTDKYDDDPVAVDFAEERVTQTGVNKTSFVENCATSALGRAISQLGGALSPKGKKPSREEMEKVQRGQQVNWVAQATTLKTVEELRKLYAKANVSGAKPEELNEIKRLADERSSSKPKGSVRGVSDGTKEGATK